MRILVTGGAGFIGSHLADALFGLGHRVTVLDNLSTGRPENLSPGLPLVRGDIRDGEALKRLFAEIRPEVVFHLAAQMNVRKSIIDPSRDADVNILGSLSVFQASVHANVRRVVFASSGGAIYGEMGGRPFRETDNPRPTSPYGIAKMAAELYGRHFEEAGGPEFLALRLANVYGPRQNPEGEAGVIALFVREMSAGGSPIIYGDGLQTRDFVWVDDVVQGFLCALEGPVGTYNIGTGKETSVNEIFSYLRDSLGFEKEPRRKEAIPAEVRRNALSFEWARAHLGWTPRTELKQGLEEVARLSAPASFVPVLKKVKSLGTG